MNSFVFRASSTTIAEYLRLLNCLRVIQQYSGVFLALPEDTRLVKRAPSLVSLKIGPHLLSDVFYSTKPLSLPLWSIPSCRPRQWLHDPPLRRRQS